jgi:hypothetical protein
MRSSRICPTATEPTYICELGASRQLVRLVLATRDVLLVCVLFAGHHCSRDRGHRLLGSGSSCHRNDEWNSHSLLGLVKKRKSGRGWQNEHGDQHVELAEHNKGTLTEANSCMSSAKAEDDVSLQVRRPARRYLATRGLPCSCPRRPWWCIPASYSLRISPPST